MPWIDSQSGEVLDPKLFATPAAGSSAAGAPTAAPTPGGPVFIDAETRQPVDPSSIIPAGKMPKPGPILAGPQPNVFSRAGSLLDQPQLGPTGQAMQNWIQSKTAWLPQSIRPYVETTQTPAEKFAQLASIAGIAGEKLGPESWWATVPARYGLPLAAAGVGGALEAQPGRRLETAGQEMLKTGLGLVPSAMLGSVTSAPIIRSIPGVKPLGTALSAGLRTQAGPIGRQVETNPPATMAESMMLGSLVNVVERARELVRGFPPPE